MKKNIAVMFGGNSVEHEISVITALQAIRHIDDKKYNIIPIYIKNGEWFSGEELLKIQFYKEGLSSHQVSMVADSQWLYYNKNGKKLKKWKVIDVALLCFHGHNGEDGSIQGLLELNGIPYTSADVLASAISCDKSLFKELINGMGMKTIDGISLTSNEYYANFQKSLKYAGILGFPVIIKPSTLGSSIGISVCRNEKDLQSALDLAFTLDTRVLIEKFIKNIREINCAVMGYGDDIFVSELEEPVRANEILTFQNKYLNNEKQGLASASRKIPADISPEIAEQIREISIQLFTKLRMKGVVRIDYILNKDEIFVNEINSIPGSLAYYLFKPCGFSYSQILDKLISWALLEKENKKKIIHNFVNDIFSKADFNRNKGKF